MKPVHFIGAFLILLTMTTTSWAFPELTRHNYNSCMVCHVSPTGGGVLSEYGRSLSKELLSTWGREGEEKFFYMAPTTEHLALGGDFRWLQNETKPPGGGPSRKRWIEMQKDLEIAGSIDKWVAAVTIGENTTAKHGSRVLSRRHYLMYKQDDEISYRVGRFYPNFGLLIPEHTSVIRRGLGWDQNQETYNFEAAYQKDKWHHFVTPVFGRPDDASLEKQKGIALSSAYHTDASSKFGLSYFYGESSELISHHFGPYAVIPFGEKFYLMGQVTALRTFPYSADEHQWGLVDYLKFNYEPVKGLHVFMTQEFSQSNLNSGTTRTDIHSLGLQFFPRPHFEFQVAGFRQHSQGLQNPPAEGINFVMHFYP